jgi:hypothetical protein
MAFLVQYYNQKEHRWIKKFSKICLKNFVPEVGFVVLTVVVMKIFISWDITLCG